MSDRANQARCINPQRLQETISQNKRHSQFTEWLRASASAYYINTYLTRAQTGDNVDGLNAGWHATPPPDFNTADYQGDTQILSGAIQANTHAVIVFPLGKMRHHVYPISLEHPQQ